jgi:heme/copper-type cytochrome/quinol oxidase subunit 3
MAATQLALPSGERRSDQSTVVYGMIAVGIAVIGLVGALCGAWLLVRSGTKVWPAKGVVLQDYFGNTMAITAVIGAIAGWWGLYGALRGERRQAVMGFGLAVFMQVALINLMTYVLETGNVSPRSSAFGVLYFGINIVVIVAVASGAGAALVALARSLGGHVTAEEPGLAWGAAWYTTMMAVVALVFYYLVYQIQ